MDFAFLTDFIFPLCEVMLFCIENFVVLVVEMLINHMQKHLLPTDLVVCTPIKLTDFMEPAMKTGQQSVSPV